MSDERDRGDDVRRNDAGRDDPRTGVAADERSVADTIRLGLGIALALALALFFIQNFDDADINFLWMERSIPLVFALLISAVIGGLVTWLLLALRGRSARKERELELRAMANRRR